MDATVAGSSTAATEAEQRHGAGVFWRYWTASTISGAGDAVTAVGLPLVAVQVLHADAMEVS